MKGIFGKYWYLYLLAAVLIIASAFTIQAFKSTNSLAKWLFSFINDWAAALSAAAAFLLLILGFATIREARRRQALSEFRKWARNAFRELSIPSKEEFQVLQQANLKEKLEMIRAEGVIVIDALPVNDEKRQSLQNLFNLLNDLIEEVQGENKFEKVNEIQTHFLAHLRYTHAKISE